MSRREGDRVEARCEEDRRKPRRREMRKSPFGVCWTPDSHDRVPKLGCHESLVRDYQLRNQAAFPFG